MNNPNFSSISSSAISLLETRSFTSIPFAKEAFQLISQANSTKKDDSNPLPIGVLIRIMHFERRFLSVNRGLQELGSANILEFSSGFSFRGLDLCKDPTIQYIDTDLPNIIETKQKLVSELAKRYCDYQPTNLILKPMNALNEKDFFDSVSLFNSNPISIANEGLLMYLNLQQKEDLCKIIHNILSGNGGYWITTDIYRKGEIEGRNIDNFYKQKGKEFLKRYNVENNKFLSFADAEEFFSSYDFEIYKKIEVDKSSLSSFNLLTELHPSFDSKLLGRDKTRETWILKPI